MALLIELAGGALAQTGERGLAKGGRVAVLSSGRDTAAAARIAAELRALGFTSQVRLTESAPDAADGERALRAGARASVQVDGRAGKTQVLIADVTGRTAPTVVVLEGAMGAMDPVLIVRTVELVRAALLRPAAVSREPTAVSSPPATPTPSTSAPPAPVPPEAAATMTAPPSSNATPAAPVPPEAAATMTAPPSTNATPAAPPSTNATPASPTPPPPEVVTAPTEALPSAPTPPETRRWRTGLSGGIAAASGGLAPEVVLHAQVAARVAGPLHAEIFGVAPLTSSSTSNTTGSSRSGAWLAGAGASVVSHAGPFSLEAGAGALAVWLRSSGTPATAPQPLTAATDSAMGAATYGRLGAALPLGHSLAARLDLLGGDVFRRPVLRFGNVTQAAAWGPAFLLAVAGLDLRW